MNINNINYKITLKTQDVRLLKVGCHFFKTAFKNYNFKYRFSAQPTTNKKITLLKSPHVYKKAKESFELRKYKATFYLNINSEIQNKTRILEFLLKNKPKFLSVQTHLSN